MTEATPAKMAEGFITNEALEEWKERIGVKLRIGNIFNQYVSKEAIRNYANGIGDVNPLWQDEEYAGKSRYGGTIAPPNFIVTVGYGQFWRQIVELLPDKGILHGGTELEFYQPVRAGDKITVIAKVADIREWRGGRSGRMVFVTFDIAYRNQRQELVARCQQRVIGYEVEGAKYG